MNNNVNSMNNDVDSMVGLLWHLTPAEIDRLRLRRNLTEGMRVAICVRIEESTVWHHDNYDVPH